MFVTDSPGISNATFESIQWGIQYSLVKPHSNQRKHFGEGVKCGKNEPTHDARLGSWFDACTIYCNSTTKTLLVGSKLLQ
jgi:hypothetical protein